MNKIVKSIFAGIAAVSILMLSMNFGKITAEADTLIGLNQKSTVHGHNKIRTADVDLNPTDTDGSQDTYDTGMSFVWFASVTPETGATGGMVTVIRNSNDGTANSAPGVLFLTYTGGCCQATGRVLAIGK